MDDILVLGVADGSVVRTLADEIKFKGNITGIEIYQSIIDIANTCFNLNTIPNLKIIIENSQLFRYKKYIRALFNCFDHEINFKEIVFRECTKNPQS